MPPPADRPHPVDARQGPAVRTRTVVGADGLRLAVFERNIAAPESVVLVHGYPDDHSVWDPVADLLAARFHVVTYDVRGAGDSEVPDDVAGYRLELLAEDMAAILDAPDLDAPDLDAPDPGATRPVHLVGHDWGSIQGWHFVCDHRLIGRFASYTSISGPHLDAVGEFFHRSGAHPPAPATVLLQLVKSWYVGVFQVPRLAPAFWRSPVSLRTWPRVLERTEGVPAELIPDEEQVRRTQSNGANGVNLYRANVPRALVGPQRVHTDVPVQLVVPRDDRYVSPALALCTSDIPEVVDVVAVSGGHWLPLTEPALVAELVTAHIDRNA